MSITGQIGEKLTSICLFTVTNCQIVRPRSLMHLINFKFMCLSAYLQWKLVSVRDKISGGSYRKIILFFRQPLRREETKLI